MRMLAGGLETRLPEETTVSPQARNFDRPPNPDTLHTNRANKMIGLHVVVPGFAPTEWRWIQPTNIDRGWDWQFYRAGKGACATALTASRRASKSIVVTHGYQDARTCAAIRAMRAYGRPPAVAFSFHAPFAFGFRDRFVYRRLAAFLDLFVVHSDYERELYSDQLDIPLSRIETVPWYFEETSVDQPPIVDGPYLCAVGASMRDYGTLFAAMRKLPDLQLVAVVRAENLVGLEVPPNVTVMQSVPKEQLWNVQYHSRLHVLPLAASARTGHACLTQAMYFGRPNVVADVPCISGYVSDGVTASLYRAQDAEHLASTIADLWHDDGALAALGDTGRAYALEHFSQRSMGDYVETVIDKLSDAQSQ